jgi:hypothetical protein
MGAFVEDVLPFVLDATFFQAHSFAINELKSKTIGYYKTWKEKSTMTLLEARGTQSAICMERKGHRMYTPQQARHLYNVSLLLQVFQFFKRNISLFSRSLG